jgi:hypothetical protein
LKGACPRSSRRKPAHQRSADHAVVLCSSKFPVGGSCGSGVDGEFRPDAAPVAAKAAVERKEVRRVRPVHVKLQKNEAMPKVQARRKTAHQAAPTTLRAVFFEVPRGRELRLRQWSRRRVQV